jgi:hypothetical protein
MEVVQELSQLHCSNVFCCKIRQLVGTVFRDDQFYPQDGQRAKSHSHMPVRHCSFWLMRLQALESPPFTEQELEKINYIVDRDHDRASLTCRQVRDILKCSHVKATRLNNHVPLLVKTLGGPAPPKFSYQEVRLITLRFSKAMILYDSINQDGGNKPYYPYFIYKIVEHAFKDCPEKLRLLNYIHLQSRDTVIKNDKLFEKIAGLSEPADGLVYSATDPGRH